MIADWLPDAWKDRLVAEWKVVVVTIGLAVTVAWLLLSQRSRRQQSPSPANEPRGVSRLILEPLPQDLVLEENKVLTTTRPTVSPPRRTSPNATARRHPTQATPSRQPQTLGTPSSVPSILAFANQQATHPGLDSFWHWLDEEASLFRVYQLGRRDDDSSLAPILALPPSSRRGQVQVGLRVENRSSRRIVVMWINYKGHEQKRGSLAPHGGRWEQQTYVDHPWIFRDATTQALLLTYTPQRIIPTCDEQPTVDDEEDPDLGLHSFRIVDGDDEDAPADSRIHIHDAVFPHPARTTLRTPSAAVTWCLLHLHRMDYVHWAVLQTYLTNILLDPSRSQYRHLRLANATFGPAVWNTPARGLLLALGFVVQGAFVELGTAAPMGPAAIQLVAEALAGVEVRQRQAVDHYHCAQPAGADGFGRAGFGRPGSMNNGL
jgi:hypothetical protein